MERAVNKRPTCTALRRGDKKVWEGYWCRGWGVTDHGAKLAAV